MGNMVIVDEDYLDDTGLAIQEKLSTTDKFNPSEFGNSIRNIQTGGTDGQFFPMNMLEYVLPTMTLTYEGSPI